MLCGEYLIFIDSDDYVVKNMLEIIDNAVNDSKSPELIKFCYYEVNRNISPKKDGFNFTNMSGQDALIKFINNNTNYEMAYLYAYKKDFWIKNNFRYASGRFHEDFGLTPIILMQAADVSSIDVPLYYYVRRAGSITRVFSSERLKKSAYDTLYHLDNIQNFVHNSSIKEENKKTILSHMANSIINKASSLKGQDKKDYKKELKKRNVINLLLTDTLKRKAKKLILKVKNY